MMARPFATTFDKDSLNPGSSKSNVPISYQANVNRAKTKKWTEAKVVDYGGDDWGEDEYDPYDEPPPPPMPKMTGLRQKGQGLQDHARAETFPVERKAYGDLPSRAVSGSVAAMGLHRSNSFEKDDEKRSFSSGVLGQPSAPAPAPVRPPSGPATRFSQMTPFANPDTQTSSPAPRDPSMLPPISTSTTQPVAATAPLTGLRKATATPASSVPESPLPESAQSGPPNPNDIEPILSAASDSRTSISDYQARHDYSPSAAVPPLAIQSPSATPNAMRFPGRKSSLSQNESAPGYGPPIETAIPTSANPGSPTSPSKSLPFIRPADIYRRVEEEKERERQSMDSSRPSLDSIVGAGAVEGTTSQAKPSLKKKLSSDSLNSGRKGSSVEGGDQTLPPILEPVNERVSEYGFDGFDINSAGMLPPSGVVYQGEQQSDPYKLGLDVESMRSSSTSPKLPDLNRMSAFGMDMFEASATKGTDGGPSNVETSTSHAPLSPVGEDDSQNSQNSQSSLGFRSAVQSAFDRTNAPSEPETPLSGSDVNRTNSNTTGTTGISPIVSRYPSSAQAEPPRHETSTPAILEAVAEPPLNHDSESEPDEVRTARNSQHQLMQAPAAPDPESLQPRPEAQHTESFRPSLPGGWNSYSTSGPQADDHHDLGPVEGNAPASEASRELSIEDEDRPLPLTIRSPKTVPSEGMGFAPPPPSEPFPESDSLATPVESKEEVPHPLPLSPSAPTAPETHLASTSIQTPQDETDPNHPLYRQSSYGMGRESTYLPSEYDNYWADTADDDEPVPLPKSPAQIAAEHSFAPVPPSSGSPPPPPPDSSASHPPEPPIDDDDAPLPRPSLTNRFSWEKSSGASSLQHQQPRSATATPSVVSPLSEGQLELTEPISAMLRDEASPEVEPHPPFQPTSPTEKIPHHLSQGYDGHFDPHDEKDYAMLEGAAGIVALDGSGLISADESEPKSLMVDPRGIDTSAGPQPPPPEELEGDVKQPSPPSYTENSLDPSAPSTVSPLRTPSQPQPPSVARILPFKEITAIRTPEERVQTFNQTRQQFAEMDSGLEQWITGVREQFPEHSDATSSMAGFRRSQGKPQAGGLAPTQQPYYQQYLNASSPTTASMPVPNSDASTSQYGTQSFSTSGSKKSTQQVQAKGKELLHTAGVFGGKAGKAGKGLFAKGKSKFRGSGSGDKTTQDSPPPKPKDSKRSSWAGMPLSFSRSRGRADSTSQNSLDDTSASLSHRRGTSSVASSLRHSYSPTTTRSMAYASGGLYHPDTPLHQPDDALGPAAVPAPNPAPAMPHDVHPIDATESDHDDHETPTPIPESHRAPWGQETAGTPVSEEEDDPFDDHQEPQDPFTYKEAQPPVNKEPAEYVDQVNNTHHQRAESPKQPSYNQSPSAVDDPLSAAAVPRQEPVEKRVDVPARSLTQKLQPMRDGKGWMMVDYDAAEDLPHNHGTYHSDNIVVNYAQGPRNAPLSPIPVSPTHGTEVVADPRRASRRVPGTPAVPLNLEPGPISNGSKTFPESRTMSMLNRPKFDDSFLKSAAPASPTKSASKPVPQLAPASPPGMAPQIVPRPLITTSGKAAAMLGLDTIRPAEPTRVSSFKGLPPIPTTELDLSSLHLGFDAQPGRLEDDEYDPPSADPAHAEAWSHRDQSTLYTQAPDPPVSPVQTIHDEESARQPYPLGHERDISAASSIMSARSQTFQPVPIDETGRRATLPLLTSQVAGAPRPVDPRHPAETRRPPDLRVPNAGMNAPQNFASRMAPKIAPHPAPPIAQYSTPNVAPDPVQPAEVPRPGSRRKSQDSWIPNVMKLGSKGQGRRESEPQRRQSSDQIRPAQPPAPGPGPIIRDKWGGRINAPSQAQPPQPSPQPLQKSFEHPPSSANRYPGLFKLEGNPQAPLQKPSDPPAAYYQRPIDREEAFLPRQQTSEYQLPGVGPPSDEPRSASRRNSGFFREIGDKLSRSASRERSMSTSREDDDFRPRGHERTGSDVTSDDGQSKKGKEKRRSGLFSSFSRNSTDSAITPVPVHTKNMSHLLGYPTTSSPSEQAHIVPPVAPVAQVPLVAPQPEKKKGFIGMLLSDAKPKYRQASQPSIPPQPAPQAPQSAQQMRPPQNFQQAFHPQNVQGHPQQQQPWPQQMRPSSQPTQQMQPGQPIQQARSLQPQPSLAGLPPQSNRPPQPSSPDTDVNDDEDVILPLQGTHSPEPPTQPPQSFKSRQSSLPGQQAQRTGQPGQYPPLTLPAKSGQPRNGQAQNGQPQHGQAQNGQPQFGQPPPSQTPFGQPPPGHPQNGQPQNGQSLLGQRKPSLQGISPTQAVQPQQTVQPSRAAQPQQAIQPGQPLPHAQTTQPMQPMPPGQPMQQGQPIQPMQPGQPMQQGQPMQPGQPMPGQLQPSNSIHFTPSFGPRTDSFQTHEPRQPHRASTTALTQEPPGRKKRFPSITGMFGGKTPGGTPRGSVSDESQGPPKLVHSHTQPAEPPIDPYMTYLDPRTAARQPRTTNTAIMSQAQQYQHAQRVALLAKTQAAQEGRPAEEGPRMQAQQIQVSPSSQSPISPNQLQQTARQGSLPPPTQQLPQPPNQQMLPPLPTQQLPQIPQHPNQVPRPTGSASPIDEYRPDMKGRKSSTTIGILGGLIGRRGDKKGDQMSPAAAQPPVQQFARQNTAPPQFQDAQQRNQQPPQHDMQSARGRQPSRAPFYENGPIPENHVGSPSQPPNKPLPQPAARKGSIRDNPVDLVGYYQPQQALNDVKAPLPADPRDLPQNHPANQEYQQSSREAPPYQEHERQRGSPTQLPNLNTQVVPPGRQLFKKLSREDSIARSPASVPSYQQPPYHISIPDEEDDDSLDQPIPEEKYSPIEMRPAPQARIVETRSREIPLSQATPEARQRLTGSIQPESSPAQHQPTHANEVTRRPIRAVTEDLAPATPLKWTPPQSEVGLNRSNTHQTVASTMSQVSGISGYQSSSDKRSLSREPENHERLQQVVPQQPQAIRSSAQNYSTAARISTQAAPRPVLKDPPPVASTQEIRSQTIYAPPPPSRHSDLYDASPRREATFNEESDKSSEPSTRGARAVIAQPGTSPVDPAKNSMANHMASQIVQPTINIEAHPAVRPLAQTVATPISNSSVPPPAPAPEAPLPPVPAAAPAKFEINAPAATETPVVKNTVISHSPREPVHESEPEKMRTPASTTTSLPQSASSITPKAIVVPPRGSEHDEAPPPLVSPEPVAEEKIYYSGGNDEVHELEEEPLNMSATSYPGQEWNPYMGFDDYD